MNTCSFGVNTGKKYKPDTFKEYVLLKYKANLLAKDQRVWISRKSSKDVQEIM